MPISLLCTKITSLDACGCVTVVVYIKHNTIQQTYRQTFLLKFTTQIFHKNIASHKYTGKAQPYSKRRQKKKKKKENRQRKNSFLFVFVKKKNTNFFSFKIHICAVFHFIKKKEKEEGKK